MRHAGRRQTGRRRLRRELLHLPGALPRRPLPQRSPAQRPLGAAARLPGATSLSRRSNRAAGLRPGNSSKAMPPGATARSSRRAGKACCSLRSTAPCRRLGGNGGYDPYEAVRDEEKGGWTTRSAGLERRPGEVHQAVRLLARPRLLRLGGGRSPFGGSLDTGCDSNYLRRPDGGVELLGRGSLGEVPGALPSWITAGATHVIFATRASPTAVSDPARAQRPAGRDCAVYDRTPGGPTHVVSLLPGDVTPTESAGYTGASTDGSVVLFAFPGADPKSLYARIDNASTCGSPNPAGPSPGSPKKATASSTCRAATSSPATSARPAAPGRARAPPTQITTTHDVKVVNFSADGSHV